MCPDCQAYLEAWRDRGRCPWTRPTDVPPDDGPWTCTRPYLRRAGAADQVRQYIIAARPGLLTG